MPEQDRLEHVPDARAKPLDRPPVSLVLPFAGSREAAGETLAGLAALRLGQGDEIIVVDNQPGGSMPDAGGRVNVLPDATERGSYYARNRGVEVAANDWVLFIDADCRPAPDLLDRLFAAPVPEDCGLIAGGVVSALAQPELAARYARSRGMVSEAFHVSGEGVATGAPPAGITANLAVRRAAFDDVGGFHEGVFSGADIEFCWRVHELGWSLAHRPEARVEHVHPMDVRALLAKARRYGAGRRWVNRRYPGWAPRQRVARPLARSAAGVVVWTLGLQFERARFKWIDGRWALAAARGFVFGGNRALRPQPPPGGRVCAAADFPALGGDVPDPPVRVEAEARPTRPDRAAARSLRPTYAEDDLPLERFRAVLWLFARRPAAVLAEARRGWPRLAADAPAARRLAEAGATRIVALPGGEDRAESLRRLCGIGRDT
jgi:GT2 family glycosyltransferase